MYESNGRKYYIVDEHCHFWDASPENQRNKYGEGFINCFYDYHRNLSPPEYVWPLEKYQKYTEQDFEHDLFEVGHVDRAILQSTHLTDFYVNGFNTIDRNGALARKHPDRLIVNGAWDPRHGEEGMKLFKELHKEWDFQGVKLYTAEWLGASKGWKLNDYWAYRFLEMTEELGIRNVHVHKGPTIWPLNRDAFDVADVDHAASAFPNLNFVVEHCGLPRLEDFCWIATQEPNVYAGLAVVMPFIHSRPKYFGQVVGELLYWIGEDRIMFASDYALWQPGWLIEKFVDFQIPEDMQSELGTISDDQKAKILGLNAARLYGWDVPEELQVKGTEEVAIGSDPVSVA